MGRKRSGCSAGRFDADVARALCLRVIDGESVVEVCRDPAMPSRSTVDKWALRHGGFAKALVKARLAGGHRRLGPHSGYCEATAEEICDRLCEGESLKAIARDPAMPNYRTIWRWKARHPEFGEMMRAAREVQADRFVAVGWEMALEATPETAYLTGVRLAQLRWMAGHMAPAQFRTKLMEPQRPPETDTVLFRHFMVEQRKADGWLRVVSFAPDPETGKPVRQTPDDEPWDPPPRNPAHHYVPASAYMSVGMCNQPPDPPYEGQD